MKYPTIKKYEFKKQRNLILQEVYDKLCGGYLVDKNFVLVGKFYTDNGYFVIGKRTVGIDYKIFKVKYEDDLLFELLSKSYIEKYLKTFRDAVETNGKIYSNSVGVIVTEGLLIA